MYDSIYRVGSSEYHVYMYYLKFSNKQMMSLQLPEFVWSEEYQKTLLSEHFKAFDNLRKKGWFIGEMIWNFADFETDQCKYFKVHIYTIILVFNKMFG